MKRPTIQDIAEKAGVGVATVDRVLNGRARVKDDTGRRVLAAAEAIGYHAAGLIRRQLEGSREPLRLTFLLQRPEQTFYQDLSQTLLATAAAANDAGANIRACVDYLPSQDPAVVAAMLREATATANAVAMVAIDHPAVTAAVAESKARGVRVFALLSDFAPGERQAYLGVNNRKAGRSAGWFLAHAMPKRGKTAILVGSHRFHGHEMREMGCRSYLRESAPEVEVIDTQTSFEDVALAQEAVHGLLRRHPDLTGLYVAGGGMEGAISALREETAPGQVALVCPELTDVSHAALADAYVTAVIVTPRKALAEVAMRYMVDSVRNPGATPSGQIFLPFDIHIAENI